MRRWIAAMVASAALGVSLFAALAVDDATNSFGTYELDLAKSHQTPAPMPKALTVTRERSKGGVKQTTTGANGAAFFVTYTSKHDGAYVGVTGNAPFDEIAVKQADPRTVTDQRKKNGNLYVGAGRTVFSNDGKTMTVSIDGLGADGKPFSQFLVFYKK
jgi:hypothetical protein